MKIKWWLLAFLMLSIGLNVGVLTTVAIQKKQGQPQHQESSKPLPEPSPLTNNRFNRLADALELEGSTREAFIEQQVLFAEQLEESRLRLRRAHGELKDLLVDPEAEEANALAASEEAGRAYGEMDALLVRHTFKVREMLTPEQMSIYVRILNRIGPRGIAPGQPGRNARRFLGQRPEGEPLAEEGPRTRPRRRPEGQNRPPGLRRPAKRSAKGREGGTPPPREGKTSERREPGLQ